MSVQSNNEFQGTARFLIQKRLGAGGFGVVYQVYDCERDSIVALKTLQKADADDLYRFKREFRALSDLTQINLAALYELFSTDDHWFFTMEMIHGTNFLEYVTIPAAAQSMLKKEIRDMDTTVITSQVITNTPPIIYHQLRVSGSPHRECRADLLKLYPALKQLAEGLHALHQAGKLHKDIKPPNVLVTSEGVVKILDFGLVGDLSSQDIHTNSSKHIAGTPAYMSPEQAIGKPLSPAADWYSVGIMLFEVLTGKFPYMNIGIEMLLEKQRSDAPPPNQLVTGIPDELNTLCQDLLQRDPQLRPNGAEIIKIINKLTGIQSLPPTLSSNKIARSSMPFIGRETELAQMERCWQSIKKGQGVTLFIKGRSGMGKSALIRHFLDTRAMEETDLLLFSGRCYEQEFVPYKAIDAIIDLLSKFLKGLSDLEAESLLPLDVPALARLFPVLRQVNAIANARRSPLDLSDPLVLRRKAFSALRELLCRLANKKDLIIFIDDLQWGDQDSALLLHEILRLPDAPRLLFIGSYRSEEAENSIFLKALFALQAAAVEKSSITEIAIEELTTAEAEKLARALLGDTVKQYQIVVQESGGSPFFIGELARYALAQTAAQQELNHSEMTIEKVISARIAQLPHDARRLLEVVAVSGQPLARLVAKRAAELSSDEQVLPILRTNHLLRATGSNAAEEIDTYHDRIREAIMANLPNEDLQRYHHLLALALEADSPTDPERLAKHFRLAGAREKATDYIINAAEKADQALAFDRAAQLYQQTLSLNDFRGNSSTTLKVKLATALANAGKGAEAARAYLAATADSNKQEIFELQRKAAENLLNSGHTEEGLALLDVVLKKVGMRIDQPVEELLLEIFTGRAKLWMRGTKFQQRDESQVPLVKLQQIDACWTALSALGAINGIQNAYIQTRHLTLALDAGEPYRLVRALAFESGFSSYLGRSKHKRTTKFIKMAQELAEQIKSPELIAMVHNITGHSAFMEGYWRQSWQSFSMGEKISNEECQGINGGFAARGVDNALGYALRALYYLGDINLLLSRLPSLIKDANENGKLSLSRNLKVTVLYIKHLVMDEAEKAQLELSELSESSQKKWVQPGHSNRVLAQGEINLYRQSAQVTLDLIKEQWPVLQRSLILHSQVALIETLQLQARAALARAQENVDTSSNLSLAEKNANKILKQKTPYGDAWAELLLAGIYATRGKYDKSLTYLASAEKKFTDTEMALYLAATQRRRGELLGGEQGSALIGKADKWMVEHQIKNPARMTDMLAPGRWQK